MRPLMTSPLPYNRQHINFGISSGYAIGALRGIRESKDIGCLASVSKDKVTQILTETDGCRVIPQSREDYVALFWFDHVDGRDPVLIEIFPENFPWLVFTLVVILAHIEKLMRQPA